MVAQNNYLNLKPGSVPVTVHLSQGDIGRTIGFYLYNDSEPFYPDGYEVSVHGIRADGVGFGPYIVTTAADDTYVSFETTAEMTAVSGAALAEITVATDTGASVGTANFAMLVEQGTFPNGPVYDKDISVYQQILNYVQSFPAEVQGKIASLQAQIDDIVAPSGEAPSAAEVQNARIGADGVTYASLGEAIRTQVSELGAEADFFRHKVGKNVFCPLNIVEGVINSVDVIVIQSGVVQRTTRDRMPISPGDYVISVNGNAATARVLSIYDSNNTVLSRLTDVSSFTVPSNGVSYRVSYEGGEFPEHFQIEAGTVPTEYEPYFSAANLLLKDTAYYLKKNGNLKRVLANPVETLAGWYTSVGVWQSNSVAVCKKCVVDYPGQVFYYTGYIAGSAGYPFVTWFDENMTFIGPDKSHLSTESTRLYAAETTAPVNARYGFFTATDYGNNEGKTAFYVEKEVFLPPLVAPAPAAKEFVGHRAVPGIINGFNHIIEYGQSLSIGGSSLKVDDSAVNGCCEFGKLLQVPEYWLARLKLDVNGQHPVVSAVNSLATFVHKYVDPGAKFIAGSYGLGSTTIAQLMSPARQAQIKTERGFAYDIDNPGRWQAFLDSLTYGAGMANRTGEQISCPAIVYLQGEADYSSDTDIRHGYACGGDKALYKKYMGWLKTDMQNAVMNMYGQTEKPIFYIYNCSGLFVGNYQMTINQAQSEFAAENEDVVLLPAPYFTPNYNDGHLSTNGYRWYGEYIGKEIFEMSCLRSYPEQLKVVDATCDSHHVYLDTSGGNLPLVIDTYTVEEASQYGFKIMANETDAQGKVNFPITDISIEGSRIVLTVENDMTEYDWVEVEYAGVAISPKGTGNIRDSGHYGAMYTYWDDTADHGQSGELTISHVPTDKDGVSMVGKPYPMQNWLMPYYKRII